MTGRERMDAAMRVREGLTPDRVPVMCQLSLGHYFLHSGLPPLDIWHDSTVFAEALLTMQECYGFDGILVNLPGRDPSWRESIESVESRDGSTFVRWKEGLTTTAPGDDNPRVTVAGRRRRLPPSILDIDPAALFYVEPHDRLGVSRLTAFPPHQFDTLRLVRANAPDVSVHGEVFSPFSQLVELLGPADAMLALVEHPAQVKRCLARLTIGAAELAIGLLKSEADAVLMSSAFAGAGFISPQHYAEFVAPFERQVIEQIKTALPRAIVYTHTCGAIGDRLELMEATGTDGIDTLDPPPLGTIDLADARRRLGTRVFIKGNVDPVNTILRGTPRDCLRDAEQRIAIAGPRGYVLSTACSVPPHAPAENILAMVRACRPSVAEATLEQRIVRIRSDQLMPFESAIRQRVQVPADAPLSPGVSQLFRDAAERIARAAHPCAIVQPIGKEDFNRVFRGEGRNALETPMDEILPRASSLALFVATIGAQTEREVESLFRDGDPALAVVLDAYASEMTNALASELARTFGGTARALPYSPGYCGWHVSGQRALFAAVAADSIDVTLGASCLMSPLKSVSGVLIAGDAGTHRFRPRWTFCEECATAQCGPRMGSVR